ncbi:SGNH/GDSL hydrolase family protein [Acinetobacter terrestris]|uniref:SGNH/GDSL hydrolase family protein n=1 Tax=Acinetobacter terrestris TaxID=2529843 RepID=UPI003525841F
MSLKRSIRLKEFFPNLSKLYRPSSDYLQSAPKLSNDSNDSYVVMSNNEGYMISNNEYFSESKFYLLGDSTVENLYVDCDSRIHHLLEYYFLQKKIPIEVLNAGYSGSNLLGLFNVLLNKIGKNYNNFDRTVILFIPSNDFTSFLYKESYWNGTQRHANIIPHSGIFNSTQNINSNIFDLLNILELFISFCKMYNINLYISGVIFYDNASYKSELLNKINGLVKDKCAEKGVKYLNISEEMKDDYSYFYDDHHLVASGSKKIADYLFDFLKNNYSPNPDLDFYENVENLNCELGSETIWSEKILCQKDNTITLFLNIDVINKVNEKSLLWVFDFGENIVTEGVEKLINNQNIGWCTYIKNLPEKGRVCLPYSFKIPNNVTELRVGLRKFNSNSKYYVYSLKLRKFNMLFF